jgi:hypothetical protein
LKKSFTVRLPFYNSGINSKFTTKNLLQMKKLLFILAIGAFAACGSGENKDAAADSTVAPAADSTVAPAADSTVAPAADSTAKPADSTAAAPAAH